MRSREKYIVHDGREFVYFVTQKVACTSIKTALLPLFDMDVVDFERTRPDGSRALRVHKLFDASEYQIGKEQLVTDLDGKYRGYFKFAFVRNPWDRLISCYFNKFARTNAPGLKAPANTDVELYAGMPFAEFVRSVSAIPDEKANLHFRSQHTAICDPKGRVIADFIGRFENLAADFRAVTEESGVSEQVQLPHLLRSGIRKFRPYRASTTTGCRTWSARDTARTWIFSTTPTEHHLGEAGPAQMVYHHRTGAGGADSPGQTRGGLLRMSVSRIGRKAKALLGLGMGVAGNSVAGNGREAPDDRELRKARARIARQQERIQRLRKRLSDGGPDEGRRGPRTREAGTPVFFVVGQHKSGTGWLQKMLNSHPEILCSGEGKLFGRERRNEKLVGALVGTKAVQRKGKPSSLYNAIGESEYLRLWVERSVWGREDDAEEHLNRLTRLTIDYFLLGALSKAGKRKRLVGDKTPFGGSEDVREMATVYPEAKVIHIIRDGRDQAVSKMHAIWNKSTDQGGAKELLPEEGAKREAFFKDRQAFSSSGEGIFSEERLRSIVMSWREHVSSAMRYGHDLLGDGYTEVRYEDLLQRPEEEMERLFEFLGADTSEEVVNRCVESASFETQSGRKQGGEDYTLGWRKHRKGIAGDWRNVFTKRDNEIFKEEAGDLLVKLGYEKDQGW